MGDEFLEPNDAVRDAVRGLVERVRGKIVQNQHGGPLPGEIVLEGKELSPVAKRALGKQSELGQAVQHDPGRFDALDRLEDELRYLAKLKVG